MGGCSGVSPSHGRLVGEFPILKETAELTGIRLFSDLLLSVAKQEQLEPIRLVIF